MLSHHPQSRGQPVPPGRPLLTQSWGNLLFLHWPIRVELLESSLPKAIKPDLHEGIAWIGLVPFILADARLRGLPGIPGLRCFPEVNLRTYVRYRDEPGVWFFSLDAANPLAVLIARLTYRLPYHWSRIQLEEESGQRFRFRSRRIGVTRGTGACEVAWTAGEPLPKSRPNSLEWFLTERYRLYTQHRGRILSAEVWHPPWPLRKARLSGYECSLFSAAGLPDPEGDPLIHHGDEVAVSVWPIRQRGWARSLNSLPDWQPNPVQP